MSSRRPNEPYHFQANLIWWDGPFNSLPCEERKETMTLENEKVKNLTLGWGVERGLKWYFLWGGGGRIVSGQKIYLDTCVKEQYT